MDEYQRAQAGDADALSALIRRHSALVQALAARFPDCREDAFQWGCMGLLHAIRGFDTGRGTQFSTYAVPVILGEMRRAREKALGWRERKKQRALCAYLERAEEGSPDVRAVSRALGIEEAEVAYLLERLQPPVDDADACIRERIPDPRGEQWMTRFLIRDILERMREEERLLLLERFWRNRTQKELSRMLRVDQSRISRKESAAKRHFAQAWRDSERL